MEFSWWVRSWLVPIQQICCNAFRAVSDSWHSFGLCETQAHGHAKDIWIWRRARCPAPTQTLWLPDDSTSIQGHLPPKDSLPGIQHMARAQGQCFALGTAAARILCDLVRHHVELDFWCQDFFAVCVCIHLFHEIGTNLSTSLYHIQNIQSPADSCRCWTWNKDAQRCWTSASCKPSGSSTGGIVGDCPSAQPWSNLSWYGLCTNHVSDSSNVTLLMYMFNTGGFHLHSVFEPCSAPRPL